MRKKTLILCVLVTFIVSVAFTSKMLFLSLSPSARAKANDLMVIDIPELHEGQLKIEAVYGKPLYIYKPRKQDLANLKKLDDHVHDLNYSGYNEKLGLFLYWGLSTKHGCFLEHVTEPTHPDKVWYGGYIDKCHDPSYDLAGRNIISREASYIGYTVPYPNLSAPEVTLYGNGRIRINEHQKR